MRLQRVDTLSDEKGWMASEDQVKLGYAGGTSKTCEKLRKTTGSKAALCGVRPDFSTQGFLTEWLWKCVCHSQGFSLFVSCRRVPIDAEVGLYLVAHRTVLALRCIHIHSLNHWLFMSSRSSVQRVPEQWPKSGRGTFHAGIVYAESTETIQSKQREKRTCEFGQTLHHKGACKERGAKSVEN